MSKTFDRDAVSMLSKPLMTTHEMSEVMKVSETTVRTWIHKGQLRAIRVGREFRVAAKDLEAFVNAHATRPPLSSPEDRTS